MAEQNEPCSPAIFTHSRCACQKVNLPITHCACTNSPKLKTQFLIGSLSGQLVAPLQHTIGSVMIVLSHSTYLSVNFPKLESVTSVKRCLSRGNSCVSQGPVSRKAQKTFRVRKAKAKSRTLRLQSCFIHIFF